MPSIFNSFRLILFIYFILLLIPQVALAQFSTNSFIQNFTAIQTISEHKVIAGRNRISSQIEYGLGSVNLHSEFELRHRYGENLAYHLIPREIYADIYTNNSDIRLGYQRVLWGRSHGSFITDILSPFDLGNLTYTDISEVRRAILALNVTRYIDANSVQIVLQPLLSKSNLPDPGSRWFPVPSPGEALNVSLEDENSGGWNGMNAALNFRLRSPSFFDSEFYLLYWRYPIPTFGYEIFQPSEFAPLELSLQSRYHSSLMAGSGFLFQLSDRLSLKSEFLFVYSRSFTELPFNKEKLIQATEDNLLALRLFREFQNQENLYTLKRPWVHSMFGFQSNIGGFDISVQANLEWILNHNEKILAEALYPYFTVLINRSLLRDRLQLTNLNRYNPSGDDFWLQMEGRYEWSDRVELSLGANLFGGTEPGPLYGHLSFHQFRTNSFLFSKLTLYF